MLSMKFLYLFLVPEIRSKHYFIFKVWFIQSTYKVHNIFTSLKSLQIFYASMRIRMFVRV